MIRIVLSFLASVVVATFLASIVSSQIIVYELQSFGLNVTLLDRLSVTGNDLIGLTPVLAALIAPSFLVGFIIAKIAHRFLGGNKLYWYLASGVTSLPSTIYLIKYFAGVTILASVRTLPGLFLVVICCILSAWLFYVLTNSYEVEDNNNEA